MRCYGCGSNQGTETTLCPSCNNFRATQVFSVKKVIGSSYKLDRKTAFHIYRDLIVKVLIGTTLLVLVSGMYRHINSDVFSFARSIDEKVFRLCLDEAGHAVEALIASREYKPSENSALVTGGRFSVFLNKYFRGSDGEKKYRALLHGDGSICSDIHDICTRAETSTDCTQLLR